MKRRPFVSIPQAGPGHKAVTLKVGRDSVRIECDSQEQAKSLAMNLIGVLKRHFPKDEDSAKAPPSEHELA